MDGKPLVLHITRRSTRIFVSLPDATPATVGSFQEASEVILKHMIAEGYVWDDDTPILETDRVVIDHGRLPAPRAFLQRGDRIRDTHCDVLEVPFSVRMQES